MESRLKLVLATIVGAAAVSTAFVVAASASDDAAPPTSGTIPESAFQADGSIDRSQVPDFVVALDRQGNRVGYVSKNDAIPEPGLAEPSALAPVDDEVEPVYGRDLKTIVGHMYPGRGFVPVGTDPETVPPIPVGAISSSSGG